MAAAMSHRPEKETRLPARDDAAQLDFAIRPDGCPAVVGRMFSLSCSGALIMKTRTSRNALELFAAGMICIFAVPRRGEAKVVAFMVEQRRSFANGMSWGSAGPYERLDGTAY